MQIVALLLLAFIPVVYFLPSIIAKLRKHPNSKTILLVNAVFGWTLIGWLCALIWSNSSTGATVLRDGNGERVTTKTHRLCPACKAYISRGAVACRHCGRQVDAGSNGARFFLAVLLCAFATQSLLFCQESFAQEGSKKISPRAFMCEQFEFAELDSVGFEELEQLHCSAAVGAKFFLDRANETSSRDSRDRVFALSSGLSKSDRCLKIISVTGDIARRRFHKKTMSCEEYKIKTN